jgi:hypothetical protein
MDNEVPATILKERAKTAADQLRREEVYNYQEGNILADVVDYITSTYNEHYAITQNFQTIDVWEMRGSLESTAIDTAIKYLMRYGRKGGRNKKDLLKAIHYCVLALYANTVEFEPHKSNMAIPQPKDNDND